MAKQTGAAQSVQQTAVGDSPVRSTEGVAGSADPTSTSLEAVSTGVGQRT